MSRRCVHVFAIGWPVLLAALCSHVHAISGAQSTGASGAQSPGVAGQLPQLPTVDTQAPTVPAGLTATPTSSSQVNLVWSASSDSVGVASYRVYRGGALAATLGNATSYSDTGLADSTTYSYAVSACDAAGNCSMQSAPASATTQAARAPTLLGNTGTGQLGQLPATDTQVPTVPAGLTITSSSPTQSNLLWSASSDNVGVASYRVYRSGALIATLGNVTSYGDSGLAASTSYSYTVSACDAAGNCSAQSTSASVRTQTLPDTQAPTAPTGLTAASISASQIDLYWTYALDNVGVTAYRIFRGGALIATLGNVTSYSDTGLAAATAHTYAVSACDAARNCSAQSAAASAITQAPPIPTIRVAPVATGTPTGPITGQIITVSVTPPANVMNLNANLFFAAVLPPPLGNTVFVMSASGGWTAFTACSTASAARVGPLSSGIQISVSSAPMDLSGLKGTSIYVGYGFGATSAAACTDMLNSSTITRAYTVN